MRDNQQLLFVLEKLLPGSIAGTDFQVATVYEADGVTIKEDAKLVRWSLDLTQPTDDQINNYWNSTYSTLWDQGVAAAEASEVARRAKVVIDAII